MARHNVRLRPYTHSARLMRGVTNIELWITKAELSGVQDVSAGRFEVVFKTKAAVDPFLPDLIVEVREEEVRFEYRSSRVNDERVFQYTLEKQDKELRRVLSAYGTVHAIHRETIPAFAEISSVIMRLQMDMAWLVQNLVRVLNRDVMCFEYKGVVHQCVRCGVTATTRLHAPLPSARSVSRLGTRCATYRAQRARATSRQKK